MSFCLCSRLTYCLMGPMWHPQPAHLGSRREGRANCILSPFYQEGESFSRNPQQTPTYISVTGIVMKPTL